jgi:hypothetical protein
MLLEVCVVKTCQQSALKHLLALLNGQLDNAPSDLEANQTLVCLDVTRESKLVGGRWLLDQPGIEMGARRNGCSQQDQDRNDSLHRLKPHMNKPQQQFRH